MQCNWKQLFSLFTVANAQGTETLDCNKDKLGYVGKTF